MKRAIKYIADAGPIYLHLKKHSCPFCRSSVTLTYRAKVINSKSPEAKNYDFSLGDTFLSGDVEFRTRYFYCSSCPCDITIKQMKQYERQQLLGFRRR